MTGSQRAARIFFASTIIGACAVGLAGQSQAEPGGCDPMARSMTPHQPSACDAPPAPLLDAPPVEEAPPAPLPAEVAPPALLPAEDAPVPPQA
ncbi:MULTISPECIES: hypothetical protein [unclassified Mycobacterium]|uniref:hypothetical protein n=1 Tax=unclassified Mycobacterium TaxID=2642494 RepID=UPI0029C70E8D|nr:MULTISPECIES: hypothetical protein [unclassified Mycobacterium]